MKISGMLLKKRLDQLDSDLESIQNDLIFEEMPAFEELKEPLAALLREARKLKNILEEKKKILEGPELEVLYIFSRDLKLRSRFIQRRYQRIRDFKLPKTKAVVERKEILATSAA